MKLLIGKVKGKADIKLKSEHRSVLLGMIVLEMACNCLPQTFKLTFLSS